MPSVFCNIHQLHRLAMCLAWINTTCFIMSSRLSSQAQFYHCAEVLYCVTDVKSCLLYTSMFHKVRVNSLLDLHISFHLYLLWWQALNLKNIICRKESMTNMSESFSRYYGWLWLESLQNYTAILSTCILICSEIWVDYFLFKTCLIPNQKWKRFSNKKYLLEKKTFFSKMLQVIHCVISSHTMRGVW